MLEKEAAFIQSEEMELEITDGRFFVGKNDVGHPTADYLFSVRPSNNENGLLLFLSRFSSV